MGGAGALSFMGLGSRRGTTTEGPRGLGELAPLLPPWEIHQGPDAWELSKLFVNVDGSVWHQHQPSRMALLPFQESSHYPKGSAELNCF